MCSFLLQLKKILDNHINLYVNKNAFIDISELGAGCDFDEKLSLSICKSIFMIVVFTPPYKDKDHIYCQREYMAMERIEKERIKKLGGRINNSRMIVPIIFRGKESDLPSNMKNIQYLDIAKFTTASMDLENNREFNIEIDKIARTIYEYSKAFERQNIDPCKCDSFKLPAEKKIKPWEEKSPLYPFPRRRM
jgi:hypothetical protein